MNKLAIFAAIALAALVAACNSRRGDPFVGSVPIEDPNVEGGRVVFMENCYRCHPGGEAGLGPSLNDKRYPKFWTKHRIRKHGISGPAFPKSQLGGQELDDLMAYLAALRRYDERREGEEAVSSR